MTERPVAAEPRTISPYFFCITLFMLLAPFAVFGQEDRAGHNTSGTPSGHNHAHHGHHAARTASGVPAMAQWIQRTPNLRVAYFSDEMPIPINKLHSWRLKVMTPQGKPVTGATIRIAGDMPGHGHGLPTEPEATREISDGVYLVEGVKFSMPGQWIMEFDIEANGLRETAAFSLVLQ